MVLNQLMENLFFLFLCIIDGYYTIFLENLFLCITDGYYTIFLENPNWHLKCFFDIDNLCGPQSTYLTKEIPKIIIIIIIIN
jgi:hypothetical protein